MVFSERGSDRIGMISPDGILTERLLPTMSCAPTGIATASDGSIWVAAFSADRIVQLMP